MDANYAKKQYRTVGLTVFIISIALLVMRIVSYYVQVAMIDSTIDEAWLDLLFDAIFTVPVQVGLLFLFPFLMYKCVLKKPVKSVFEFSGYRKCSIWVCLLSFLLGIFVIGVSYALSMIWQILLIILGYTPSGGSSALPEQFNPLFFILSVLLTAVLPAICEEFTNRGGLLTVMRSSYSKTKTIILIGLAFGLFHQFIGQFFYTAMFGALLAYLVLETQSVYPAIIVHFTNNFMSVYLDHASEYNWVIGGGFYDFIYDKMAESFTLLTSIVALICLAVFGLVAAIVIISRKTRKKDFYLELNTVQGETGVKMGIKDNVFFIGAIVVTAVSTLITFVFGL